MTALPRSTTNARLRSTVNALSHSRANALLRSTTNLLALAVAALLLISPEIAHGLAGPPVPPPPPPLPEDDSGGDDLFLLQASVAPNVILFIDNSDSMNQIEWHPAFDPDKVPDATYCTLSADVPELGGVLDPDHTYIDSQDWNNVNCDTPARGDRTVYFVQHPKDTLWSGRYLMWYLGLDDVTDAAILDEIDTAEANVEGCTQSGGSSAFADMYRRTRFEASKQVLLDLLCLAEPKNVRFGSAEFREADDAGGVDPNGGFITADLDRDNPWHAADLESAIVNSSTTLTDGTPLAETLFQIYTYWMPHTATTVAADMPIGENGNHFPIYEYNKFGDRVGSASWLGETMKYDCEKAFVIIVTDGGPTRDTFELVDVSDPTDTALGFADYGTGVAVGLIGDYHIEAGTLLDPIDVEEPGGTDEPSYYLDDIAKYMYDKDFRPDLDGEQTIDTYVVGFATGDPDNATNKYLWKVANNGNGVFYTAKTGDELTAKLVEALNDIIEKAASFTAATVPSARTADGTNFYQSYFFPRSKSAFWEGHIRAWTLTGLGEIVDSDGVCALDDPDAPECNSGPFLSTAQWHWDAADEVPLPADRKLYVSKTDDDCGTAVAGETRPPFFRADAGVDEICYEDLGLVAFTVPSDPAPNDLGYPAVGSTAINAEGLAHEIVQYVRGCFFGTGVNPSGLGTPTADVSTPIDCLERPARLGDIFHSNAIIIRQPHLRNKGADYDNFKAHYEHRDKLLYAGTNGGFLEGIDAGTWVSSPPAPALPGYDKGTGAEVFGFMPWEPRQNIKNLAVDNPTDRTNYVDGDVNVADAWIDLDGDNASPSNGSEWRTYLLGALREGGHHYYALDVTNPNEITPIDPFESDEFPLYAWEFPPEGDPATGDRPFMGETWAKPIITKVRLKKYLGPAGSYVDRWVAIVTGGYDGTSDPNPEEVTGSTSSYDNFGTPLTGSTKGRGIYIIDLTTGEVLGERKFNGDAAVNPESQEGMVFSVVTTTAVADLNFDGAADVIYVGDMGGNIWKWSIHDLGEDPVLDATPDRSQPNWPLKTFFAAASATTAGADDYKNIMFPPAVAYKGGSLYLAFGTGERRNLTFGGDDSDTAENNRFFVMIDSDPYETASPTLGTITEADLTDFSGSAAAQAFVNKGFYFELVDGEKFVTNVEIFAGQVIAATFYPTTSDDPCVTRGAGTLYVFDLKTGEGYFDDGAGGSERWMDLGAGLPTDPKVSYGNPTKIIIEGQNKIDALDGPEPHLNGATLYWRESD